jgi:hypothetical protein
LPIRVLPAIPNLHEVVELCAAADNRAPKGCSVYRRIGADFSIVMNFDNAGLRYLDPLGTMPRIAKAIATDNDPGV